MRGNFVSMWQLPHGGVGYLFATFWKQNVKCSSRGAWAGLELTDDDDDDNDDDDDDDDDDT